MKTRRRRYIVSSGFQWKFVIGFITIALMGSVVATVLFSFLATKRLGELQWSVFLNMQSTGDILRPLFIYVNLFSLIFVAVLLVAAGSYMMRKMNGPLSRIAKDLDLIKKGDFSSDIVLRRNDEFKDVSAALNEMLEKTREKFAELRTGHGEISQALIELEIAHAKGLPVDERGGEIISMIRNLRKKIYNVPS